MIDVSHIESKSAGRPQGASKYLAALLEVPHSVTVQQAAYAVGVMTGKEPSYGLTYSSLRSLVQNGQVIRYPDSTYAPANR